MNRTTARRLQLASQTLRILEPGSLRRVDGGETAIPVLPETQAKGNCKTESTDPTQPSWYPPAGGG